VEVKPDMKLEESEIKGNRNLGFMGAVQYMCKRSIFLPMYLGTKTAPQAWDAFNRYMSEVVGKKQTLNISTLKGN